MADPDEPSALDPIAADATEAELRVQLDRERSSRLARREIQRLASGAVSARDPDDVARLLVGAVTHIFHAEYSSVAFRDGDLVRFVHGPDLPDDLAARWSTVPAGTDMPLVRALDPDGTWIELPTPRHLADWPAFTSEAARTGVKGYLAVPLRPDHGTDPVGALGLGFAHEVHLDAEERQLLAEIVEIASTAVVRASELRHARQVSAEFQSASIADDLPRVDGLTVRSLYSAGDSAAAVGGDWYDVVPRPDGSVALVIGDVSGHDISSAARVAGVRHVLASHLLESGDAAVALEATDRYVHLQGGSTFATAAVIVLDEARVGGHVALAGHPPPLRIVAHGVTACTAPPGPPIGAGLGGYRHDAVHLEPGDAIVAFTDGLVERRGRTIDQGIAELAAGLGALGDRRPSALLRGLRRCLDEAVTDDVAVLLAVRTA